MTDGVAPLLSSLEGVAGLPRRPRWQTGQVGGEAHLQVVDVPGPVLSEESRRLAERIMARYPTPRSALVPLLYLVQAEVGWVPRQGMREVAQLLGLTTAEVEAVATFYTMLKLHPCGKYVISICTNPSCALLGGRRLFERARELLGEEAEGGVTPDGLFTLEEEECLAACDKAPVLAVNYLYFDRVTEERLVEIVEAIRAGRVPQASRGGVPGELREVSRTLAGLGTLGEGATAPRAPSGPASDPGDEAVAGPSEPAGGRETDAGLGPSGGPTPPGGPGPAGGPGPWGPTPRGGPGPGGQGGTVSEGEAGG